MSGSIKSGDNKARCDGGRDSTWLNETSKKKKKKKRRTAGRRWLLPRSVARSPQQRDKLSYCASLFAVTDAISSRRSRIDSAPAWRDGG